MSAEENVAIMQRAYDAFNAADIDTLTELFDESIVWHLPGKSSMADDYQGRDATLAYFGQIGERTGGTFQAELQQLFAGADGRVIGLQRSTRGTRREEPRCEQLHRLRAQGRQGRRRQGALQRPLRLGRVLVVGVDRS